MVDVSPLILFLITITAAHDLKSKDNSDIVLVPQPADDPNDPLKWPAWKKGIAAVSVMVFSGMGG